MAHFVIKHSRYLKGSFNREGIFVLAEEEALVESMYVQASPESPVTIDVPSGHAVDEQMMATDEAGQKEKKQWREKNAKAATEAAKNPLTGPAPSVTPKENDEIYKGEKPKAHFADKAPHPQSSAGVRAQEQENALKHQSSGKHGGKGGGRGADEEPI